MAWSKNWKRNLLITAAQVSAIFIGLTVVMALWGFIWSFPLTWAWNYVMPDMFGLKRIGYWQMFCLYMIVCALWKITVTTVETKR